MHLRVDMCRPLKIQIIPTMPILATALGHLCGPRANLPSARLEGKQRLLTWALRLSKPRHAVQDRREHSSAELHELLQVRDADSTKTYAAMR